MTRTVLRANAAWMTLCMAVCLTGCHKDDRTVGGDAAHQTAIGVQTALVVTRPFTETLGATGLIAGRPDHMASLSAPTQAQVVRVMTALGDHVAQGAPLVQFDETNFTAAVQSADAALTAAEKSYTRTQRLTNEGIAPRKELEQASAALAQARSNVAIAKKQQALSTLRAPIAGVVTRVTATLGAMVDPAQILVEIVDPSALDLILNVAPDAAAQVKPGDAIVLYTAQNTTGKALGKATVVDVGRTVDSSAHTVVVRAHVTTMQQPLRVGEMLFGDIIVRVRPNAIVVPEDALVPDGERFKVFVVDSAHIAHATWVQVGGHTSHAAEITAGLHAGERIVTYGAYGVEDSATVVPLDHAHR